jgi:pimeloyl-ACP methyl ester carboxylesterase
VRQVLQSPQGELEIARGSGHVIQLDQPGKVVDAVRKVLRMAR